MLQRWHWWWSPVSFCRKWLGKCGGGGRVYEGGGWTFEIHFVFCIIIVYYFLYNYCDHFIVWRLRAQWFFSFFLVLYSVFFFDQQVMLLFYPSLFLCHNIICHPLPPIILSLSILCIFLMTLKEVDNERQNVKWKWIFLTQPTFPMMIK